MYLNLLLTSVICRKSKQTEADDVEAQVKVTSE